MATLHEKNILLDAIQAAGTAIAKLHRSDFKTIHKANLSPLTEADLLANEILQKHLLHAFPSDGWLSEETVDDRKRLTCDRIWIVDPLDGTKEFVKGIAEYAISVALIEKGKAILSAIYNPITQELFHALQGQGAWLNGTKIHCNYPYHGKLKILASRTEMAQGDWDHFKEKAEIEVIGSIAYKLALVAASKAHATFSLGPKSEWDIAAGVLLIQEAGGIVTDKNHQPFIFNQPNTRVNGIIASSAATDALIKDLIQDNS